MTEIDLTFEEALAELERIVERLEAGDLTLDETISLYERGQALAAHCEQALSQAELRLEALRPAPGGGYETAPFEGDAEA